VVSEQGPSLRHSCMASRSCQCRASTSRVDCKDLSDSLEGGCHAALLFSWRCAIREDKGCILTTNSYRMAGRQFHQSGGDPLILAKGNRLTSPEVRQIQELSQTTLLALFLPSTLASVLYSRDVIQKKPGQLGSEMHACNRMLDLPKPGACSHLSRLPCSREQ
jgi:hypothetical protein